MEKKNKLKSFFHAVFINNLAYKIFAVVGGFVIWLLIRLAIGL